MHRTADKRIDYFAEVFKVLGSDVRLKIVRLLIECGEAGLCVTDIQKEVNVAGPTLSHHLDKLSRYGLLRSRKQAQWIYYTVNYQAFKELFAFLWEDCCSRNPQLVEFNPKN